MSFEKLYRSLGIQIPNDRTRCFGDVWGMIGTRIPHQVSMNQLLQRWIFHPENKWQFWDCYYPYNWCFGGAHLVAPNTPCTWPLFLKVNPSKQGLLEPKEGSSGFQVYIYIYRLLFLIGVHPKSAKTWNANQIASCFFFFGATRIRKVSPKTWWFKSSVPDLVGGHLTTCRL